MARCSGRAWLPPGRDLTIRPPARQLALLRSRSPRSRCDGRTRPLRLRLGGSLALPCGAMIQAWGYRTNSPLPQPRPVVGCARLSGDGIPAGMLAASRCPFGIRAYDTSPPSTVRCRCVECAEAGIKRFGCGVVSVFSDRRGCNLASPSPECSTGSLIQSEFDRQFSRRGRARNSGARSLHLRPHRP